MTPEEIDFLLERWDQTDPQMQRQIVAEFARRLTKAEDAIREAEARGEQRGRIEGLKEAAKLECELCRKNDDRPSIEGWIIYRHYDDGIWWPCLANRVMHRIAELEAAK